MTTATVETMKLSDVKDRHAFLSVRRTKLADESGSAKAQLAKLEGKIATARAALAEGGGSVDAVTAATRELEGARSTLGTLTAALAAVDTECGQVEGVIAQHDGMAEKARQEKAAAPLKAELRGCAEQLVEAIVGIRSTLGRAGTLAEQLRKECPLAAPMEPFKLGDLVLELERAWPDRFEVPGKYDAGLPSEAFGAFLMRILDGPGRVTPSPHWPEKFNIQR